MNCVSETEKGIFDSIIEGKLDLQSAPWPSISDAAKDLIRKMLTKDPKKRITAADVLGKHMNVCETATSKFMGSCPLMSFGLCILPRASMDEERW